METKESNDFMTLIGPGQPAGDLLRRYWMPVGVAQELSDENPTKFVRLLGENLVLFKDKTGRVGLLADKCSHRNASLVYGRVEERGISCAYHGWLYDCEGNILETPPERNDAIMKSVKQKAYPVRKLVGLYWAYLGTGEPPEIPRYDVWERKDGRRRITVQPRLDCNWLVAMENSMDSAHTQVLHQGGRALNTTRGLIDEIEKYDFYLVEHGLMKKRVWKDGTVDEHPVLFPNILRHARETQIRVPIDDTHTQIYMVDFFPSADGSIVDDQEPEVEYTGSFKEPAEALHPFTHFTLRPEWLKSHNAQPEDHMAWETQGPIADRTVEHLSYSDKGVSLYRKVLKENIVKVQAGMDPMGIIRDPDHEIIDTNLAESMVLLARPQRLRRTEPAAVSAVGPFQWDEPAQ